MRHKKHKHQLGVKKAHRLALMANLATALITHGRIETTLAKAKALRPFIEKIVTLAKKASAAEDSSKAVHLRRQAFSKLRDKDAVSLLFNERVSEFSERNGGYTRIYKIGRRTGDAAEMALIEFVPGDDEGYQKPKKKAAKKAAPKKSAAKKSAAKKKVEAKAKEQLEAPEAELQEEKSADEAEK